MATTPRRSRLLRWMLRGALIGVLLAGVGAALGGWWLDQRILSDLPDDLSAFRDWRPRASVHVHDAAGRRIDSFHVERRTWVDLDTLPAHVGEAFVVAEDRRFWEHPGIDLLSIARALWVNYQAGEVTQGASTLTQQLVKNLLVGDEISYERKLKEAVLAWRLEQELTKHQLLELYVNYVFLGAGNYGVEAAAQDYFGIPASELDPGQAALIAGLIPAPSRYNPRSDPELARWRRALVLGSLVEAGVVDAVDAIDLMADPVLIPSPSATGGVEAAYVTQVRRELRRLVGNKAAFREGLAVFTPYEPEVQQVAVQAVRDAVDAVEERQDTEGVQGAAVVLENATGRVIALVGGYETELEGFVRATQARRQPGSSFKPYVYAAALRDRHTQLDVVMDAPLSLPAGGGRVWRPGNYGGGFAGPVTLRRALSHSLNTVAVRLTLEASPSAIARQARAMGVSSPLRTDATLGLGSSEVTPMDQALGFATIARLGVPVEPAYIDRLEDGLGAVVGVRGGPIVLEAESVATLPGAPRPRALPAGTSYELLDMLREVVRAGTARRAWREGLDRAGKTGTTNDFVDAWFVGCTPRFTVAVWIGRDSPTSLGERETGGRAALPAWIAIVDALPQPAGERFPLPGDAALVWRPEGPVGLTRGRIPREVLRWRDVGPAPLPAYPGSR